MHIGGIIAVCWKMQSKPIGHGVRGGRDPAPVPMPLLMIRKETNTLNQEAQHLAMTLVDMTHIKVIETKKLAQGKVEKTT